MYLSKKMRWAIYTALIVAFIIAGFYLTATERPDRYMPGDPKDQSMFAEPADEQSEKSNEDENPETTNSANSDSEDEEAP